jgi:hypothetical protein
MELIYKDGFQEECIDKVLLKLSNGKVKPIESINRIGLSVPTVRAELKKDLSVLANNPKSGI